MYCSAFLSALREAKGINHSMDKIIGGEFAIDPISFLGAEKTLKRSGNIDYSSGRCALFAILKDIEYEHGAQEILLPDYLCDSITRTVIDAGWKYKFYKIDAGLNADFISIQDGINENCRVILLINYFGMTDLSGIISKIKVQIFNAVIVIDNVQALFEPVADDADYVFTSYRKWFPCPDGAHAYKKNQGKIRSLPMKPNRFAQYKFAGNVLKSFSAHVDDNISLNLLGEGEKILDVEYLCECSEITKRIAETLDFEKIAKRRRRNAKILHDVLEKLNILHIYEEEKTPLFVPIFIDSGDEIRRYFFRNRIFTPIHWPFVSTELNGKNDLYGRELSLICDQRYDEEDMRRQAEVLKQILYQLKED